jgi:hypothetical protein
MFDVHFFSFFRKNKLAPMGFIPARISFIIPKIAQFKVLLHLKVKAGVNRFAVQTYFMVRVFKDLPLG